MSWHKRIEKLLVDFVLGGLSQQQSSEVTEHLADCNRCRAEIERLRALLACTGQMSELSADEQLCELAKQGISAAVATEEVTRKTRGQNIRPTFIWRRIMESPITKLGSAAAIVIAVAVAIMHFGTTIDGTSRVWAQAVQNIEQATSAIFREKRTFTCDGEQQPFVSGDAVCYYSSEYGERDDMYSAEGVLLHQIFWLPRESVRIRVIPPLKQFERTEFNEAERAFWDQPSIQAIVELSKSRNPTPLGRKVINGREAEGFESSEMGEVVPVQVDRGVARCWIDLETGLPIRYETEFLTRDRYATLLTHGKPVLVRTTGYESEWNVEIEPKIFEPDIPPDYVDIGAFKSVSTVHVIGRDSDDNQIEMWSEVNPDTGLMTNFYLDQIDRRIITVSTPKETYFYDLNTNIVEIRDGPGLECPFRIGYFIEDITKLAKRIDGHVQQSEAFDSKLGRDAIVLEMTSPRGDVKAIVDPATKLPARFDSAEGLSFRQPFKWKSMEIVYEDPLPEGIFEFVIPDSATVVRDTIETKDEITSAEVLQYSARVHTESAERTERTDKWCNTRITVVDADMNVYSGGAFYVTNDSSSVWTGEIRLSTTTDSTRVAVFNEKGVRLAARLVQHKPLSGGRFREYITLDEPLHPGQRRSFLYWDGYGRPCQRTDAENGYTLAMDNNPGNCLESFILVLAPGVEISQSSQDHTFYEEINGCEVYVWQEHVSAGERHKVTVELVKRKQN
ncbi:MAG: zf-HC2 domain-containing protein [Phycisphaerales bacterium]|nr:MAG: zf-HC2 domain-containing protein [Phycisphaerales bacterium]